MADMNFEEIMIGDEVAFERIFNRQDVLEFAALSGDKNPLHLDDAYAKKTKFKKPIVHGMLVASLCSTLVGMYLPGKRCLYLSQTLNFRKPVFIGDKVKVNGSVSSKSLSTGIIEIQISIKRDGEEVLEGIAKVQVLSPSI